MAPSTEDPKNSPLSVPIRASYIWSLQEHRDSIAAVNAYQASARRLRMLLMYAVAVGLAFIGIQSIRGGQTTTGAIWLIFAVVWIGFRSSTRWRTWLIRDPWRGKRIDWEFTEDGFTQKAEDIPAREVSWSEIRNAAISTDGILLFKSSRIFYWIPSNAFGEGEGRERLVDIIGKSVNSFRQVG